MSRIEKHWVLIDMEKLTKDTGTPEIFGSITEITRQNIKNNGKNLTYDQLRRRLLERKEGLRYWKNDRYVIKECIVNRSKEKLKR